VLRLARKARVPLRLDIVGLDPERFRASLKNVQALIESKTKGSVSRSEGNSSGDVYFRIALIALDFQRAYGRAVEVRVFEKSANRIIGKLMAFKSAGPGQIPEFFVNGVKIFRGIPMSFSQLDEAIENAFGKSTWVFSYFLLPLIKPGFFRDVIAQYPSIEIAINALIASVAVYAASPGIHLGISSRNCCRIDKVGLRRL
jgi:hypothetical protein